MSQKKSENKKVKPVLPNLGNRVYYFTRENMQVQAKTLKEATKKVLKNK